MQYSRPLLTFAYVKESLERTGDLVQGLIPLFAPIIKMRAHSDFDPKVFSDDVNQYYGLRMHPYVAEDWRDRLEKAGYLHAVKKDGLIERYINLDPDLATDTEREAKYFELIGEFTNNVIDGLRKWGICRRDWRLQAERAELFSGLCHSTVSRRM